MKILQHIFGQRLAFKPIDPLGDGLREMIEKERRSPHAIRLEEDNSNIVNFWRNVDIDE